jgi:hypothetical protein
MLKNIVIWVLCLGVLPGLAQPRLSNEALVLESAKAFSRKSKAWPSEYGQGIKFGIRLHSSCLTALGQQGSLKGNLETFEKLVDDSISQVRECREKYPELSQWLDPWLSLPPNTLIICAGEGDYEKNVGAVNSSTTDSLRLLNPHASEGIKLSKRNLRKDGRTMIILPEHVVKEIVAKINDPQQRNSMIHEGLHSTRANNHFNPLHDEVGLFQNSNASKNDLCSGIDISGDRVYLIAGLCGDAKGSAQVRDFMKEKIKQCGPKFCEKRFTDRLVWGAWVNMESKGLGKKEAMALCNRFVDQPPAEETVRDAPVRRHKKNARVTHRSPG